MVSPHIASTLRLRNVSKGSRLWRRDASRSAAPSAGTTRSGTARVTVCPIIGTACNKAHTPDAIQRQPSPATPPRTLPRTGPVMKPRLKPSRIVDITRLSDRWDRGSIGPALRRRSVSRSPRRTRAP